MFSETVPITTKTEATLETVPLIIEAVVTEDVNNGIVTYTCEAVANPPPSFMWQALDADNVEVTLTNDLDGIEIFVEEEDLEVSSFLIIPIDSEFSMPKCTASNNAGEDVRTFDQFVTEILEGM